MKRTRHLFLLTSALVGSLLLTNGGARGGKLEPFLERLADGQDVKTIRPDIPLLAWDAEEATRSHVRVLIERQDSTPQTQLRAALQAAAPRAEWEGGSGRFAQVVLPWSDLQTVASLPEVFYIFRPPRGRICAYTSEGLDAMRVPPFQDRGYLGQNVRIAVVDLGFDGYESRLGKELPNEVKVRSFYDSPSGEGDIYGRDEYGVGEPHGTACAEIIHDIAPEAELYLVNVLTPVDLLSAVEWLIDQKVMVISHSVGWYFGGLDGTGPINNVAQMAIDAGIVWVNAAGNEAERHTWAYASDQDGDDLLEFEDGDEQIDFTRLTVGQTLGIALLWDLWPLSTSLDLVIEFVDETGALLATSAADFAGYPYAFRYLEVVATGGQPIGVRVRRNRGSIDGRIVHLFRVGSGVRMEEHPRPDRSLLAPADSPDVITAGAIDWETEELDSYSSRGALDAAPIKPELCGPVGISTATYGTEDFRGTSAAAPHVAGAAALIASAGLQGGLYDLLWSRDDILHLLATYARPAGDIVPLAWGLVTVPNDVVSNQVRGPLLLGNPAHGALRWIGSDGEIEIVDLLGRVIASPSQGHWTGDRKDGRSAPAGTYWIRQSDRPGATRFVWLGR